MAQRPWQILALALVAFIALATNFDPVISWLPGLPGSGGGAALTEAAKQALVLAAALTILLAISAALVALKPSAAATAFLPVIGIAAVLSVGLFLVLFALGSDDRAVFAYGTLAVVGFAGLASIGQLAMPSWANVSSIPVFALISAVVLVGAYGLALNFMFGRAATDNTTEWERLLGLFSGVQSIGFAAVGALLGNQVQKGQTDAERLRADQNKAASDSRDALIDSQPQLAADRANLPKAR